MYELIYAGDDVKELCGKQFPNATITDASDEIHTNRFEFEDTTISRMDFMTFALENDFIICCFEFNLAMCMPDAVSDEWKPIFDMVKQWCDNKRRLETIK